MTKHNTNFDDVAEFHDKFDLGLLQTPGHLTQRKLMERANFMQEELDEFRSDINTQNLALQADALVDLVYVALGTAHMMGLPWADLWDDVHRANMAKVRGVTHRGNKVDMMKPPGWEGPNTMRILSEHGYRRYHYVKGQQDIGSGSQDIDESLCADDSAYREDLT